jgi:DNA-binding MarR family transcriptional regulator
LLSIPSIIEAFIEAKLFRMSKQSELSQNMVEAAEAAAAFGAAAATVDEAAASAFGVNRTDLRMIGILHERGALTAGQLAVSCNLSPAATSTAIQRLVRAGHVTRNTDSDDRRRAAVSITAAAATRLKGIYGPVGRAGMTQLAEYDDEQLALLTSFLRRGVELQHTQAERIRTQQSD